MGSATTYEGRDASLRYVSYESPGSDAMIVGFPKLRPGGSKPASGQREFVGNLPAHQLYLGSDAHQFVGPRRGLHGANAALDLIQETTERLGVPRERVVYVGTSYGAVIGTILALMGGGFVLAGAPAVAVGTVVKRWAALGAGGGKGEGDAFAALGAGDDGVEPVVWLDTLIPRLAEAAAQPVRMRFVSGPQDYGFPSTTRFVAATKELPFVSAELIELENQPHAQIARTFWSMLPQLFAEELG